MSTNGPQYLDDINVTDTAYWDSAARCWRDNQTREKIPEPPRHELRTVAVDTLLMRLTALAPELELIVSSHTTQTLETFCKAVLARAEQDQPRSVTDAAHALIERVVTSKAQDNTSFGWTIEKKVEEIVVGFLRSLVEKAISERLASEPGLITSVVNKALSAEALHEQAHNLITPRLMKLVEEMKLTLSAGADNRNRY